MQPEDVNALLQDVKCYLQITWEDEKTNKNILGYIKRGISKLNNVAGKEMNYLEESEARSLLFDYCRYANSQALEMFEKNFQSELLSLNLDTQANLIELE